MSEAKGVNVHLTGDAYDFRVKAELAAGDVDDTGLTPTERERLRQEFHRTFTPTDNAPRVEGYCGDGTVHEPHDHEALRLRCIGHGPSGGGAS